MPEDKNLVPLEGELVSTDAAGNSELDAVFAKMYEIVNQAIAGLLTQNIRDVDIAARTADALYALGKARASPAEQLTLNILRHVTFLYTPLARALAFQIEGRFSNARDEIAKGLATSNAALAIIQEYAQLPDADKELIETYRPVFRIFPIQFSGMDAYVRADIVGYQGNIRQYRELLLAAIREFRQAEALPSSLNPLFLTLVNMCTTQADRLSTRVEVSASWEEPRYLRPTGGNIFIIHGHAEAKWRELQSLLKNEFGLDAVVLKEEPAAGETLIQKFEKYADDCCYAFALLTPDDFIEKEGTSYFQARPNVLFEVGWFYGHFGRDRVCIVKRAKTEIPSDLAGILSIDFHDDVSEGLVKIRAELQRIGIIAGETRRPTRRLTGRAKKLRAG